MRLKGRVVIVTGAARGLGREFALCVAEEGAKVVVASSSDANETVKEIKNFGGEAIGVKVDITKAESVDKMALVAMESFNSIDALVNNAAIYGGLKRKPSEELDGVVWDEVLQVNVKGTWRCCSAVIPYMKKQKSGSIVNISSSSIFSGLPYLSHYVASKGAIWAFTRSLSRELGDFHIRVNSITPGYTKTEASEKLSDDPDIIKKIYERRIFKRAMLPSDLRGALIFLLSDESSFITGQNINVDGGAVHY